MTRIITIIIVLTCLTVTCTEQQVSYLPEDYSGWKSTTDIVLNYFVPGHEKNFRKIFINETGQKPILTTVDNKTHWEYPDGTIIIKEIYPTTDVAPAGTKPIALTAMVKKNNDPLAVAGWVWVVKHLDTGQENIMDRETCANCHNAANSFHPYGDQNVNEEFRDYVFFPYRE